MDSLRYVNHFGKTSGSCLDFTAGVTNELPDKKECENSSPDPNTYNAIILFTFYVCRIGEE